MSEPRDKESAVSFYDEATTAWAKRAEREIENRAAQLRRKLAPIIKRTDFEVVDLFTEEVNPILRVAADIDGIIFCLQKEGAMSVVNWRCSNKNCSQIRREPISDLPSIGRALAYGDKLQVETPDCGGHSRLAPKSPVAV